METVLMAQSWQSKQAVKGWGASLAFHACLAVGCVWPPAEDDHDC